MPSPKVSSSFMKTKHRPMKTPQKTLIVYRTTWWIGVPLWAISFLIIIMNGIAYDKCESYQTLYHNLFNTIDENYLVGIAIVMILLVFLTYIYLLLWFILSTDWYIRNMSKVEITVFDKIRWMAVLLVLVIRPILIMES